MSSLSSFEDFCGGTFWNSTLSWDTPPGESPDLTLCFQQTVLLWVPCAFLWLSLPVYLYNLCTASSEFSTHVDKLYVAKIVTGLLLIALALCDAIKYGVESQKDQSPTLVLLVSPLILAGTLIISVVLMTLERRKGYLTSGVLFVFYFLLLLAGTFKFASFVLDLRSKTDDDVFRSATFFASYFLNVLMVLLLCFAASRPDLEADPKTCPEVKSSFLSRITFWWITSLILQGYKSALTEKDVFKLNPRDKVQTTLPAFLSSWDKELQSCNWSRRAKPVRRLKRRSEHTPNQNEDAGNERMPLLNSAEATQNVPKSSEKQKKPSLFKALARVYGWDLVVAHFFKLLADGLTFAGPLIQGQLITFIDSSVEAKWHGYLYAVMFFGVAVLQSILMQQMFHIGMSLAMRIKGVLMSAVYKKALTISNQARKNTTVGEIVNLMSVDTDRIQNVIGYLWIVWSCPLQIAVAIYLLYQRLGVAVFAGLGALFLLLPINYAVARFQQRLEVKQMGLKDSRVKILNEILNGIKVLKLYAWELSFKDKVDQVRNAEVANLRLFWYLGTVGVLCWTVAPFLVMLTSFATFVLMGNVLDANTAFVSLSLFNILQFPINLLPLLVSFIVTSVVSLGRLGNFLRQPDIETHSVSSTGESDYRVKIKNGTFAWGTDENDVPALKDIDLELKDGSLVAIVGLVGSGKSSVMSAMLGEMEKLEGSVTVNGSTAYVAQQAWIQNATVRDNILFGKPFDEDKYKAVIDACALKTDLEILTAGDMTEIGEKGINLSGGQKQRVALARAVYQDLDIYFFDDPLSAVDAHVGKHIFEKVVGRNGILKTKSRILVTHGIHWLPMVDEIVVMDHGMISEKGSYEELMHHDGAFAQFLKTYLTKQTEENEDDKDDEEEEDVDPEVAELQRAILERMESVYSDVSDTGEAPDKTTLRRRLSRRLSSIKPVSKEEAERDLKKEEKRKAEEKLIEAEQSETGRVKLSVIIAYMKALGLLNALLIFLLYTVYQAASVFGNLWLTSWTSDPVLRNSSIPSNSSEFLATRDKYLGVYGGSGIAQALFVMLYSLILAYASVRASAKLHSSMLYSVLRSPMSFFDTTPIGRILNRFSRDIEAVDNMIPDIIIQVAGSGYTVIASFFVISFSTPVFLALLVPITILYYLIQRFFIPASRQLKRLESNNRSPVYAHFSESVSGAATIRAFRKQQEFEDKSDQLVEQNNVYYFATICANRWLNFRLDLLGGLVILGAALFAVIEKDTSGGISGSVAGLSVSYALQATQELNWFVRTISEFELNIVSVERISQYIKLTPEAEWRKESGKALANWPPHGEIEFENYSTRYRPGLDLVVKDINLRIKPQEKIGICGRTGAGKSSLTTALFRLIEAVHGNILIDNITIGDLGLHDLRSRLTILPQDPVLFSGTLRMNLDPFSTYSDSDIWWSLDKSHLKSFVEKLPAGLTYECGEGGQNLSVGQRQLLCLGRALLRKTKVLVLDEATAAVDMETDSLIQNTIRTEFKDCTILTIAHRLNTIMDSDRILVLDKGQVAEFDTPNRLLEDESSLLYKMAKEAGLV